MMVDTLAKQKTSTGKKLSLYRKKRDFSKTKEPYGEGAVSSAERRRFSIQRHDASHLHYDFRLELDGVLKSWAVPKGPSPDPSIKRLAIEVEDHPLSYWNFEGEIPQGEYGAGTVELWDYGYWEPLEKKPQEALKKGSLKFKLFGNKLNGTWALVRIQSKDAAKQKPWLLIKEKENHEEKTNKQSLVLPSDLAPQLATLVTHPPEGTDWLHEIKYDGYRFLAYCHGEKVVLKTRRNHDWSSHFPHILAELAKLRLKKTILDGEIVFLRPDGMTDFQKLQNSLKASDDLSLKYVVFDVLFSAGSDLRFFPLIDRKEILQKIFKKNKSSTVRNSIVLPSSYIEGHGRELFENFCKAGLEGVVSKQIQSVYVHSRSISWQKAKCIMRQEFIIAGYTTPSGARTGFGALLMAYYEGNRLIYCGRVGTGFTDASLEEIISKIKPLVRKTSAFDKGPVGREKLGVTWIRPKLVAEIEFRGWTADGRLRAPSFKGLRADKKVEEVKREIPVSSVTLTNPEKIFYPKAKITKKNVMEYYERVSDLILPHIKERPLALLRCPNGIHGEVFFQKHFDDKTLPSELSSVKIKGSEGLRDYPIVNDVSGLMRLAQLGVLEIHPWGSTSQNVEKPDRMVFDLDPGPGVSPKEVIRAAFLVKKYLIDSSKLQSFVKTTGGKGLHVVVPIVPELSWNRVKAFCEALAKLIASEEPNFFTAIMSKKIRNKKIFIDYLRNGRGATSIATFSTRAREGAPVSVPLDWSEIKGKSHWPQISIKNIEERLKVNPWKDFFSCNQKLSL